MSLFTIVPDDLKGYDHLVPYNFSGAKARARDIGCNQIVHCDWGGKCLVLERYNFFSFLFYIVSFTEFS